MRTFTAACILGASVMLYAQETSTEESLEMLVEEMSEIATKHSLNVDYLPSVVTILDGQKLQDSGAQTIAQALELLPSVQIQHSTIGYIMTTVRGFKNPNAYLSDKVRVFIDGVALNNEATGSASYFMDFPISLVEKIEVLRGPASTLYGSGSFYGAINIVTKLASAVAEDSIYVKIGSYEEVGVGSKIYEKVANWNLSADGYYTQNNKQLHNTQDNPWSSKDRVGISQEALKDFSVGFKASTDVISFSSRLKKNKSDNFLSFEGQYNPIPERDESHGDTYFFTELKYEDMWHDYKLEAKANYSYHKAFLNSNAYSVNEAAGKFDDVNITMLEGFYTQQEFAEQNLQAELTVQLPEIYGNTITLGTGISESKMLEDKYYSSVEATIIENQAAILAHPNYSTFDYNEADEPAFWHNPTTSTFKKDISRRNMYAYMQDFITLHENLDMTLGLRFDSFNDQKDQLSKRAGIVYRASEKFIVKALYGSAFRAPSFTEMYANGHINYRQGVEDIKPEETDTYELAFIYSPNIKNKVALNLFHSKLNNVIDLEEDPGTDPGYQNFNKRVSQGIELEYFYKAMQEHDLYFNASYIDTEYTIPPEPLSGGGFEEPNNVAMPDISRYMFKAMYIYRPTSKLSFGTTWQYYARTTSTELDWVTEDPDMQPRVDAYHLINETITYKLTPMSSIRLSIRNLFGETIKEPSYYYLTNGGVQREGTYTSLMYEQQF